MKLKKRRIVIIIILLLLIVLVAYLSYKFLNKKSIRNDRLELTNAFEAKATYEFDVTEENNKFDVGNINIKVTNYSLDGYYLKFDLIFSNKDASKHIYNVQSWNYIYDTQALLAYNVGTIATANEESVYNSLYIKEKFNLDAVDPLVASKINGYSYIVDDYFPDNKSFLMKSYSILLPDNYDISNPITIDLLDLKYQVLNDDTFYSVEDDNLSLIRFNMNINK